MATDREDEEAQRLRQLADELGLVFDKVERAGVEGNASGIRSDQLLFSRRLDSRTYFVQDDRFGVGRESGVFDGPDEELLKAARGVLERLEVPAEEIGAESVLRETTRVGQVDPTAGGVALEEPEEGKRLALLSRRVEGLPVWSSSLILGLAKDRRIGFLQLHWPEIPGEIAAHARRFAEALERGWQAPERPGAAVESMEAGIVHSPAIGFVMDVLPAIRVIYETLDKSFGRKLTLYLDEEGNDVPIPRQFEKVDEEPLPERDKRPPQGEIEKARKSFRALLLANPNYFGTFPDIDIAPQLPLSLDTFYEEIGCVGYEPQLRRLEAVVYVKQEGGYGGGTCSAGTPEFVRFYLSFDGGATWQDQGMASFTAYDIPGKKPLEYDVTVQIEPPQAFCTTESLPLVRAILSWNNPPPANDPGFIPVWGEVQEARIQIAPKPFIILHELFELVKLEIPEPLAAVLDPKQPLQLAKAKALTVEQAHELYKESDVAPHRYLFTQLGQLIASPQLAVGPGLAVSAIGKELGLDLASVIGQLLQTDGNTSFEELRCVGLNPDQSALVGVLTVKLSSGYSGNLCTAGSKEYVAFWIDYGAGFTYAGTTSVTVHDLAGIPPEGLQYAVFLPVDLTGHQRPCEQGAVTARVRAILSWETPPPPGNPDFVPTWGNREETTIHIRPGIVVDGQVPFLSAVGDIPESSVAADGKADGTAIHTGFVASDSPFGGRITIGGHISNPSSGLKYRVMRKPFGAPDSDYVPLTREPMGLPLIVNTWDPVNGWDQTTTIVHDLGDGYYPFEDYSPNHSVEGDMMMIWDSTFGEHELVFDLRIDLSVDGNPLNDVHSNVVTVLIDNVGPNAELDIDLGAGVDCADFNLNTTFTGTYTATDPHFGEFSFEILPAGPAHGVLPTPASGKSVRYGGAIPDPGVSSATYTLNTQGMDACGYALVLHVWDRTNVNSGAGSHYNKASVGFCLRAPVG